MNYYINEKHGPDVCYSFQVELTTEAFCILPQLRERSLFRAPGGPRKKQGGSRTFHFLGSEGHELFGFSTVRVMNI